MSDKMSEFQSGPKTEMGAGIVSEVEAEIDWANNEAVVRAAVPDAWKGQVGVWTNTKVWKRQSGSGFLGLDWCEARLHTSVVDFEREHNPAFKVTSSLVGEREGMFEYTKEFIKWWCGPNRKMNNDNADQRNAYKVWNARAALPSKPAPEGIPESAENFLLLEGFADSRAHSAMAIAALMDRYAQAIISAKDVEIAAERSKYSAYRNEMVTALDTAEAELASLRASSEAKDFDIRRLLECMKGIWASFGLPPHEVMDVLSATCVPAEVEHNLRASSAKVREEALREAAAVDIGLPIGAVNPVYEAGFGSGWRNAEYWFRKGIEKLLPKSQEAGQ